MIIKIEPRYKKFSDFFFEADGDDNNDKPAMQKYSIKPHKRRGNDYTAIEPEEDDGENDSPSATADTLNDDSDGDDYTSTPDDNDSSDSTGSSDNSDDVAVLDDDSDEDGDDYTSTPDESDGGNDTTNDNGDSSDDAAVLDDDDGEEGSDYTDTSETDSDGDDDSDGNNNQGQSEEDTSEARRKFYLYQKFVSMYNHVTKQIDTLQSSSYDNIYYTSILKLVLSKLISLKKAIYEFLMVKFDNVSYVQSYLYYETCYNIMKMCIELLQNTVDKLKQ